ncbi:MAG: L-ribulose-5-phosphate 4-epimerase [Bacteroidetes bacterium]|nr:L-ribulose-5-phosphate 4-epimerase [Bacteroidota bacterium]
MFSDLKQRVYEANIELTRRNLITYTWGNVSGIDRDQKIIIIKPSGVSYDTMKVDDMVITDMEGTLLEGSYKPSSDLLTHAVLYKAFPECNAIVHTHSRNSTAWAQAGCDIPAFGTTHADYFYGPIPCTRKMTLEEIQNSYEKQTGNVIIETFMTRNINPSSTPAVLVNSHGPFSWGKTPEEAVHNAVVLEEVAYMARISVSINPDTLPMQQELLDKHFLRKHGKNAYYGQS